MSADATSPPPSRRRFLRGLAWAFSGLLSLVLVLVAGAYVLLGSQAALDYVVRRAVADADGHLVIEGAEGSLLSTVRVARIAWTGDELDVEARETALAWSPLDLLSRKLVVQGLGAKRLSLTFKTSGASSPTALPGTLALPLEVEVRNIGVERLDWRTQTQSGFVSGITFGYAGGAREHAIDKLRFVADAGTLAGSARMGAAAPYPLSATLAFEGDGELKGGQADLAVSGQLERLAVEAKGTLRNASVAVKAGVTPFAPALVTNADVDARNVDLKEFAPALPATALTLALTARPEGGGFAGTLTARNAAAGAIDGGRVPVTALTSSFAWDGTTLALRDLDAELAGGGRARGSVALAVEASQVKLDLTLANVDLARLHASLISTRLSGTLAGEVDKARQVLRGNLAQGDLGLAFAGAIEGKTVTLERATARAGTGTLSGSGTLSLAAPRAFTLSARATRFNPARFVAMPEAQLDGTVLAKGTLSPPFAIAADVEIAPGSRFAGLDVRGKGHGEATPTTVKNVTLDAALGTATIALRGGYGTTADAMAYDVDIPRLAQFRPLAARYAKDALPDPLSGSLRAKGKVSGDPHVPGVTIDAHAQGLEWGTTLRAAALDVVGSIAPGPVLAERPIKVTVSATALRAPQGALATLKAGIDGTLARHKATLAATGEGIDLAASFTGGATETAWNGTIDTLTNRGTYALSLLAPATLSVARDKVDLGAARIDVADGRVEIVRLLVEEGRITTQGTLTGVPMVAAAKLAGTPLPFHSTLVIGGEWSITAAPRMSGSLSLRRERGDWYATESTTLDPGGLALGISELALQARIDNDALAATASFRSTRAGTADATFTLAAGAKPGRIDVDAPFTATVNADLASLRPLQPWVGTLAVMDGRAHVDITGRGTLAQPVLTGTLTGDALRFDLPQYGVHLKDGTLRARLADRSIMLDDFSFAGGAGRFTAKGTLVGAASGGSGTVEWQAENFTIVNRPDLRLVADGKGTLKFEGRKLVLAGSIGMDEGQVEYEPSRVGRLSEDVVIVGQPRKAADTTMRDLPLALDLEVTLGRNFRFSGEGLDTRLAGRVHVTTSPSGLIVAKGNIRSVAGTYHVFGQRLDIDRGRLIFDGPVDNPALDVVALRKNLAVEAGIELSGTIKVPRVRLVSNPPVPDNEKLSWLLTGQGLDRASRNDFALLGAASASLIGGPSKKPITTQIANTFGLDDISVRDTGSSVSTGTSTQVVAFGKRISDRLSLVYEQGLSVASNALRIEYALSRTLTLRAEAGTVSSVGLYYRRTYD